MCSSSFSAASATVDLHHIWEHSPCNEPAFSTGSTAQEELVLTVRFGRRQRQPSAHAPIGSRLSEADSANRQATRANDPYRRSLNQLSCNLNATCLSPGD